MLVLYEYIRNQIIHIQQYNLLLTIKKDHTWIC
jgi:hypothetical protein